MHGFTQYTPTRIIFGKETQKQAGELAKSLKASKVFVVYGGGSVVRSGLLDEVTASLEEAGLEYMTVGGVKPNPRLSFAREAVKKSIEFGTDFVLAVGGGSVIDTSKAVAHGTANPDTDIWEFWSKKQTVKKSLPVGVVLTLAAAGSETSDSAVLTNEETKIKRGLSTDFNRPAFAIMNPELTYTLPKYQVGCGIVDIMMHTLDRYFTQTENNELTDEIAEGLLRTVIRNITRFLIIYYFFSNSIYPPTIFFILFYKIQYPNIWYLMWLLYNKSIFNILKDFQISYIMFIIILNSIA